MRTGRPDKMKEARNNLKLSLASVDVPFTLRLPDIGRNCSSSIGYFNEIGTARSNGAQMASREDVFFGLHSERTMKQVTPDPKKVIRTENDIRKSTFTQRSASQVYHPLGLQRKFESIKISAFASLPKQQACSYTNKNQKKAQNPAQRKVIYSDRYCPKPKQSEQNLTFSSSKHGVVQAYVSLELRSKQHIQQNTLKTAHRQSREWRNTQHSISFFGIYESRNGPCRARFMAENFHKLLLADRHLLASFCDSAKRAFNKVNHIFQSEAQYSDDVSLAKILISVLINEKMYVIRSGNLSATVSLNGGESIQSINMQRQSVFEDQHSFTQWLMVPNPKFRGEKEEIEIRQYTIDDRFDFVLLASEGVSELHKAPRPLVRGLWKTLLATREPPAQSTPTNRMAQCCRQICTKAMEASGGQRSSVAIMVCLAGARECLEETQKLHLPFTRIQDCLHRSQGSSEDLLRNSAPCAITQSEEPIRQPSNIRLLY